MSQTIQKLDLYKLDRRFGMGNDGDNGLRDALNRLRLLAGDNPIAHVNDCETIADWVESNTGVFDVTIDGTNQKVGTYGVRMTATAACDGTQNVSTTIIKGSAAAPLGGVDWREYDFFGGWQFAIASGDFANLGEMKFNIKNNGVWGTAVNVPIPTYNVHQRFDINITSFTRDKVEAIRFECANPTATDAVMYDDLIVYKFSAGRGPVMGACKALPVKSETTLIPGDIAKFSSAAVHRIDEAAAAGVENIGVCVIGGTGDNGFPPAEAIFQYNGWIYLRANAATIAGESIIWQSFSATQGHLVEGGATGVDENAFAKGYEAAGAQYDDILCELVRTATFVS